MEHSGGIHVFTGDGKGKTTAALGFAWDMICRGRRVFMVQLLKAPDTSGEHFTAKTLAPLFEIRPMGRKGFIGKSGPSDSDKEMARAALRAANDAMHEGKYDAVILDEVNVAVHMGLLSVKEVLDLLYQAPRNVDIVLTGRYAHPDIMARARSILQMRKVKHPFDQGVHATEGIEY